MAGRQKDTLRLSAIPRMIDAWYGILMRYHASDPAMAVACLQVIARYIGKVSGTGLRACPAPLLAERLQELTSHGRMLWSSPSLPGWQSGPT